MEVQDRIKQTIKAMRESNAIDEDKYLTYVAAIDTWIESISMLSERIDELESELSVKENLLKIKNGLIGKIYFPCEKAKTMKEVLNSDTEDIQDDVHRFGIEYCQKHIRGNDRKKEFGEICDMFNGYMEECNKGGVIRFLAELTQKLRENGVVYTVESLGGEINVKDIETGNPRKITVSIDGIPKEYTTEKICEIVRAYEDIKHCKEHAGEHLHSEEHLKIIQLRQKIDCLERNSSKKDELIESLKSKLDESVGGERNLCEEIEKLEQEKRENRDKMFPYESIEDMKERIASFEDRYQSDCITINQLNVCIDILCEKYSVLREIHGHKEDKLCGC